MCLGADILAYQILKFFARLFASKAFAKTFRSTGITGLPPDLLQDSFTGLCRAFARLFLPDFLQYSLVAIFAIFAIFAVYSLVAGSMRLSDSVSHSGKKEVPRGLA